MSVDTNPTVRGVKRTLSVTLLLNLLVSVVKLVVGSSINSISMVADGFHSLTDSASNVVGLIGISWAAQPPDEDHPYGHWKFETLAALMIGGLLTMTAWEVLRSCFGRFESGNTPQVSTIAFVVMGATMIVNIAVSTFEHRRGLRLSSELLLADAAHTKSDVLVSLAVIGSLVAAQLGYPQLDAVMALGITFIIARTALRILRRSAMRLTDSALVPANEVRRIALTVAGVEDVHKIRSRISPEGGLADLHVQVRADLPLDEAHAIGHRVVDRLCQELDLHDVVTHVEPHSPGRLTDS